jgi:hypothetical protein
MHFSDDDDDVWAETDYRILQCRGCQSVYFQTDAVCSENADIDVNPSTGEDEWILNHTITYWSAPASSIRQRPDWFDQLLFVDHELYSFMGDIYMALNNELCVLCAIGIRTSFDRASQLLGVDPKKNFRDKLCELVQCGKIGSDEQETLNILTDAGSAAAHRGWKPEPEQLNAMMDIIETFLSRVFVVDTAAKKLKGIPERQKRQPSPLTNEDPLLCPLQTR